MFSTILPLAHEYDAFGFLPQSSAVPEMEIWPPSAPMNFLERMSNAIMCLHWRWKHYQYTKKMDLLIHPSLDMPQMPFLGDLHRNVSLVFYPGHLITDHVRTLPPLYVNIAGIHCKPSVKPLPQVKTHNTCISSLIFVGQRVTVFDTGFARIYWSWRKRRLERWIRLCQPWNPRRVIEFTS